MSLPLVLVALAAACPSSTPVVGAAGLAKVADVPSEEAMRLNREGKQLYRQERWIEAREKYQAALAVAPDFLGPQLNVACSFARQGRYADAAEEAAKLIRRSFVPWNREVAEAADLGILQAQDVYAKIASARIDAAAAWGRQVRGGVFFVARTKPPIRLAGDGVLALGLAQEIFAWLPETGRYFQVTAEDGHVLAFALSADGQRLAYLLSGRLVRQAGQAPSLRGLAIRVLELATMTAGPPLPIPGDVTRVRLAYRQLPELQVVDASGSTVQYRLSSEKLEVGPPSAGISGPSVWLTSRGVAPTTRTVSRAGCRFQLATRQDASGAWGVEVRRRRGKPFVLDARYGSGLDGLPFPEAALADTDRGPSGPDGK